MYSQKVKINLYLIKKLHNSIKVDNRNFQNIKPLKEANIILRGNSLKKFKIKNKNLPTFIVSCLSPNELENLSLIFSKNLIIKSKMVYLL